MSLLISAACMPGTPSATELGQHVRDAMPTSWDSMPGTSFVKELGQHVRGSIYSEESSARHRRTADSNVRCWMYLCHNHRNEISSMWGAAALYTCDSFQPAGAMPREQLQRSFRMAASGCPRAAPSTGHGSAAAAAALPQRKDAAEKINMHI